MVWCMVSFLEKLSVPLIRLVYMRVLNLWCIISCLSHSDGLHLLVLSLNNSHPRLEVVTNHSWSLGWQNNLIGRTSNIYRVYSIVLCLLLFLWWTATWRLIGSWKMRNGILCWWQFVLYSMNWSLIILVELASTNSPPAVYRWLRIFSIWVWYYIGLFRHFI